MFRRLVILMASILVGMALLLPGGTGQVLAQEETPPTDTACINCHEDRYYLHDRGNWYCLQETKVRCTECHRGRPDTMIEEAAHTGLIANPLTNDAAVCQSCHPDDYRKRVQTYASIAGTDLTPRLYMIYEPSALVSQSGKSTGRMRLLRALPAGAWQVAGLIFLGVVSLVVFLFACRCWKVDRHANIKREAKTHV